MAKSEEEFQQFLHPLVHESMAKNDACNQQFDIGKWPRWDYNADDSTLTFSQDGKPRVVADVLIIGTTKEDRWQWTWANGDVPADRRALADPLRVFGEKNTWAKLTTAFLDSDEYIGWEMTAIAVHVLDAKGSYRFPTEEGYAYLVYREIKWIS
jgi:hypothetical protein